MSAHSWGVGSYALQLLGGCSGLSVAGLFTGQLTGSCLLPAARVTAVPPAVTFRHLAAATHPRYHFPAQPTSSPPCPPFPCRSFELHITTARLLDFFGGPYDMGPDEYFAAELASSGAAAQQA